MVHSLPGEALKVDTRSCRNYYEGKEQRTMKPLQRLVEDGIFNLSYLALPALMKLKESDYKTEIKNPQQIMAVGVQLKLTELCLQRGWESGSVSAWTQVSVLTSRQKNILWEENRLKNRSPSHSYKEMEFSIHTHTQIFFVGQILSILRY